MNKIAVITGSHRTGSESERIGHYLEEELHRQGAQSYFFSLGKNPLPLWDEGVWSDSPAWREVWGPISKELAASDGFIVVAPEWSGMVPAGLKNFFLLCGGNELAHKPALIVAVSSGIGGSYPIAELRMSSYKNTRICYIPDHIIVRSSERMLKGAEASDHHDESLRTRITYSVALLLEYSQALKAVRESGRIDYKTFPYGL